MNSWRLKLKLWGVRGSTPTAQPQNLGYGGNTSCLEVRLPGDELFVFDAGTGIRGLGLALNDTAKTGVHLFLTHFHWDHIQGLPFFAPLYDPTRPVSFYSAKYAAPLRETLAGQMKSPYFPVPFDVVAKNREFVDLGGDPIRIGEITVRPFQMNHPQGASGYRIESDGAVIVYASDREHGHAELDAVVRDFAQDADILIHDTQYTLEEYERCRGWGHSTCQEAVSVARDANVKQLILFHHDPAHDDKFMSAMVEETRHDFPNTVGGCEGWSATI